MNLRILRYMFVRRTFYLFYLIILLVLLFIYMQRDAVIDVLDRRSVLLKIDESIKHQANSGACKQPNLPVYAPELMQFIKEYPPINCSKAPLDWVICKDTECNISEEIIAQKGRVICSFTDIIRVSEFSFEEGETVSTDSGYKLEKSDTVRVNCISLEETWSSLLTTVRFDKDVWERTSWKMTPDDGLKMNVFMMAFDSLSRNTVIRKMPKTYKYLTETLNTLVLQGYNIIGDGTPQALTPMLTGKTELELPDCRKRVAGSNFVDIYPFVWNEFRDSGYVTGYLEDCPTFGTYTYRLRGFNKPPTDYYMRTYYMSAQKMLSKWQPYCAGSTPRHMVMLNYVKNFFSVYKNKPKFMFAFHSELSHDDYNLVGVADEDTRDFLKGLHESGALNNTMMIFMADHGHRFANIRNTMQGKLEERLPFFSFTFPPWFKNKHKVLYENFQHNVQSLATPFDVHATLKSVLHLGNVGPANLTDRSISLFSKIPHERSCAQAYIEPHWCACLEWNSIKLSSPIVQHLGDAFVSTLNDLTEPHRKKCALLKISAIYWVSQLAPNEKLLKFKKSHDYDGFVADLTGKTDIIADVYQIKVMLSPGDSLFESTITHYIKENRMEVKLSDVSRINLYGDQARCILDVPLLRKYCYCIVD